MPSAHLQGKLVFYDVPASNLDNSHKFYAALLGTDLAAIPNPKEKGVFHPLSADGIDITVHPRRKMDPPEIPIAYFAVPNLEAAVKQLAAAGGKQLHEQIYEIPLPTGAALKKYTAEAKAAGHDVGKRIGRGTVMHDPDKNPVGLVQLEGHAEFYFRAGAAHAPLRADQLAAVG
jgi:predicted enzyme related to lactoylglutathione lyase